MIECAAMIDPRELRPRETDYPDATIHSDLREGIEMITDARPHRGTIFLEDARIVSLEAFPAGQYVMRFDAPECAACAKPGSFVHVTCDPCLPMRRPLSIMRADPHAGWIDVLFKTVGQGMRALGHRQPGERVSVLGPIGHPFRTSGERPHTLLVGGGVGIPPMVFLAEQLANDRTGDWRPLVLMGSEIPFPFKVNSSQIDVPEIAPEINATMPLLEELGIAARLSSLSDISGCFNGYVTDLAATWLEAQNETVMEHTEIFACGPQPMLQAIARVAEQFDVPCQVSLEEFMACAVGGCAGCTVPVYESDGMQMKRVCVDGPVFDSRKVFPAAEL